jgi:cyclohexa-1,5-dienecarbonyl-CoA hydratase
MTTNTAVTPPLTRIGCVVSAPVARIALRNPPLNVIDIPMMEELSQLLSEIEARPDISTVLISGDGSAFSAGVDVAAHTPDKIEEMLAKFHAVIRSLVSSKKVTIAAVHAHCLGGGAEVAMVCDLVYTTNSAQWGFPEIKLGCYPPVACAALASLVGQKRAAELIFTGRLITGADAAHMGLANRAVAEEELTPAVGECLDRLKNLSSAALALAKKSFYAWDSMHFDKGLARAEKIYLEELIKTADAQEGIQSFLEKRPPKWLGR